MPIKSSTGSVGNGEAFHCSDIWRYLRGAKLGGELGR
uniref:Uncharacterized protein n=1 Tax=Arundo donax TaxID=35708 RepID=A0A0A9AJ45_ARUDO